MSVDAMCDFHLAQRTFWLMSKLKRNLQSTVMIRAMRYDASKLCHPKECMVEEKRTNEDIVRYRIVVDTVLCVDFISVTKMCVEEENLKKTVKCRDNGCGTMRRTDIFQGNA